MRRHLIDQQVKLCPLNCGPDDHECDWAAETGEDGDQDQDAKDQGVGEAGVQVLLVAVHVQVEAGVEEVNQALVAGPEAGDDAVEEGETRHVGSLSHGERVISREQIVSANFTEDDTCMHEHSGWPKGYCFFSLKREQRLGQPFG